MKQVRRDKDTGLTDREQRFVTEYLKDLQPKAAARRCGYAKSCAASVASRFLAKPHVRQYIGLRAQKALGEAQVSTQMIIRELAAIAFSRVNRYVKWGPGRSWQTVDPETLTDAELGAIQQVEITSKGRCRVRLHDKTKALKLLGDCHKLYTGEALEQQKPRHLEVILTDKRSKIPSTRPEGSPSQSGSTPV